MNRLQTAIATLHEADAEAGKRGKRSRVHPAARVIVCMAFSLVTISFPRYDLLGLLSMGLYLIVTSIWEEISLRRGLLRLKYIFFALALLGVVNLFYDKHVMFYIGTLPVTGGMIWMITLMIKGIFTVCAAYFLLLTTGINRLCMALRRFGIPKGAVTVLLLTYRYLVVLLKETQRMMQAYALRSAGQKGVHIKAWGSFAGLLLLRSMDRAQDVYDSMLLRGYNGEFMYEAEEEKAGPGIGFLYTAFWLAVFFFLRSVPLFRLVGGLF